MSDEALLDVPANTQRGRARTTAGAGAWIAALGAVAAAALIALAAVSAQLVRRMGDSPQPPGARRRVVFDTALPNVTEVAWSGPESECGIYLGRCACRWHALCGTLTRAPCSVLFPAISPLPRCSPSILRCENGDILVTHDFFGSGLGAPQAAMHAAVYASSDDGATFRFLANVTPMYWATLFTVHTDGAVFLMGTTNDGKLASAPTQVVIAQSADCGASWRTSVLTQSNVSYSTGPTPVVLHGGRLWRAFELNVGSGWASGYATVALSADASSNLMDPGSWTQSGHLPFEAVRAHVPGTWSNPLVVSSFGWLEGNAVLPHPLASSPGVQLLLRVNSLPAANQAALLTLDSPIAQPQFVQFVTFPGGMSKFSVRWDPVAQLYVTLSNKIDDDRITLPPLCGPTTSTSAAIRDSALPPCNSNQLYQCYEVAPCLWAHAVSRNNLTLSVSTDLRTWTPLAPMLQTDTGEPEIMRQITTGFQVKRATASHAVRSCEHIICPVVLLSTQTGSSTAMTSLLLCGPRIAGRTVSTTAIGFCSNASSNGDASSDAHLVAHCTKS